MGYALVLFPVALAPVSGPALAVPGDTASTSVVKIDDPPGEGCGALRDRSSGGREI